ncbi:MAG: jacalin-like lectin [Mucilaginibacter sp.]
MGQNYQKFGGNGGNSFPSENVNFIAIQSGQYIDSLTLNDTRHGGNGGDINSGFTLDTDEYISYVRVRGGAYVDNLKLVTNKGRSIEGGGGGGNLLFEKNGIRVTKIGGAANVYLDSIAFTYIDNYIPSTKVDSASFILDYKSPSTTFQAYEETDKKTADSYEKITTHMLSQEYDASVEAEYYAKVTASLKIQMQDSSQTTIRQSLETELKNSATTTTTIDGKHVGVVLQDCQIMKDNNGKCWLFPLGEQSFALIDLENPQSIDTLRGKYDISNLYDQIPALEQWKTGPDDKHPYVYYS